MHTPRVRIFIQPYMCHAVMVVVRMVFALLVLGLCFMATEAGTKNLTVYRITPRNYTGINFNCTHFHHGGGCWNKNPKDVCRCEAIETLSVGLEYPDFGAHVPAGTPSQCTNNYFVLDGLSNGNHSTIVKTIDHTTLGDCCAACTAENSVNETICHSYSFSKLEKKCTLHGLTTVSDIRPNLFASAGFFSGLGLPAYLQRATGTLSKLMNGTWYSTQEPGRCKPGQVIGKDCWWREIKQTAQVNASCVNDFMIEKVKAQRKGECFDQCPHPADQESDCFIRCLFETLIGNATASPPVPATPRPVIVEAFEAAFAPGGCTPVPDCPSPCLPPCWGVPEGDPCNPSSEFYY